jgi:hypothetical protein
LSQSPKPLSVLVILQVGSCIFAQGWPHTAILLPMAFPTAVIIGKYHQTQLND